MKQTILFSSGGGCGCERNPITGGLIRCARHEIAYQQTMQALGDLEGKRKESGHLPPELISEYQQRTRALFALRGVYGLEALQAVMA